MPLVSSLLTLHETRWQGENSEKILWAMRSSDKNAVCRELVFGCQGEQWMWHAQVTRILADTLEPVVRPTGGRTSPRWLRRDWHNFNRWDRLVAETRSRIRTLLILSSCADCTVSLLAKKPQFDSWFFKLWNLSQCLDLRLGFCAFQWPLPMFSPVLS
jgi:hypothetical protein